MYYGQGDYYGQGGLGSFLGGIVKTVGGAVVGGLTGGIPGAIVGGLGGSGILGGGSRGLPIPSSPVFAPGANQPGLDVGRFGINPMAILPGGKPFVTKEAGFAPRGYHVNKSAYFLRDGTFVPAGSRYVRNRSRNFANGRALNRAISRTAGFNRLVKRSRNNLRALAKI